MNRGTGRDAPCSRVGCGKSRSFPPKCCILIKCGCVNACCTATGAAGFVNPPLTTLRKDVRRDGRKARAARCSGGGSMALKVELKPHERIIIGACVITNTEQRTKLLIEGERIPILREKDILTPATADTPAKLIYLAVQLMYLSPDPQAHHAAYFSLMRDMLNAAPSSWPFIESINKHILNGHVYLALKEAKKLIAHEARMQKSARNMHAAKSA